MTASEFAAQAVHPDGSYDVYRPYFNDECNATTCYVGRDAGGDPPPDALPGDARASPTSRQTATSSSRS